MNEEMAPQQNRQTLNSGYWDARWQLGETGWDIGYAAPAITNYAGQLTDKSIPVLIPGCGSAYEAQYLLENGFTNITLLDISQQAVSALRKKFPEEHIQIICGDFFTHEAQYQLILEQTLFCAIIPEQRVEYVHKAASLLSDNGKIAGVLFNRNFETEGPPFGGSACEYESLFRPYFDIVKM